MPSCAVKTCKNYSQKPSKDKCVSFHLFPSDPVIASLWTEKIRRNRKEDWWKPRKNTTVCSDHFNDDEMYKTKCGLRRVHRGAVPSKGLVCCASVSEYTQDEIQITGEKSLPQSQPQPVTPSTSGRGLAEDDLDSVFDTPRKVLLRRQLRKKIILQERHTKIIRNLKAQKRRLLKKNTSLKQILQTLKSRRFVDNDVSNILSKNVFAADLFNNLYKKNHSNKKRPMPKYSPEIRKFCLTLHFYSPRAYSYVRIKFNTCLPHPKTVATWYNSIDGSPGFTDESFRILKTKVEHTDKKLICGLVADEMAIRPQNIKGGHGYVDFGAGTADCAVKATEAYVFLLVCLNEHWKIPVGYFLIHGLKSSQKCNLIKMCLNRCEEIGVKVVSLTFDGHPTNKSAMEELGCQIKNPDHLKTIFKHPSADHNVAIFLDPCHMMKLIRNHFEDKRQFLDGDENEINWAFIENLNTIQEKVGLHAANKVTRKHLEFRNSIMKVKLATQLLSRSVALALKLCREDKLDGFQESEGTEKFVLLFNNWFDIFNSLRLTDHGFRHPMCEENKDDIFSYLDDVKEYINMLHMKTSRKRTFKENDKSVKLKIKSFQSVLTTQADTGFLGILICIESLKHLYETLVVDKNEMNYITTYRLSQDHIELFFGAIRMHGGHNDNPNARQFKGIYRKLLCHMELKIGESGNCVPLENVAILTCSSALKCINSTTSSQRFDDEDEDLLQELKNMPNEEDVGYLTTYLDETPSSSFQNHIVGYISGFVARQIKRKIKCMFCLESLVSKERLWFHKLVVLRDQGGLMYASKEVFEICCIAETSIRNYLKTNCLANTDAAFKGLVIQIMSKFIGNNSLLLVVEDHVNSHHHSINLTRLVVEKYLTIRFFYESKKDNIKKSYSSKRQLFRKQLQLQGH